MSLYLASKVVVAEEPAAIPSVTPVNSSIACFAGTAERGPLADRTLVTSFAEFTRVFGGFGANYDLPLGVYLFFLAGGSYCWVTRICHFTDLTNRASYTATVGSVMRQTAGSAASPGIVSGTGVGPWQLADTEHLDIKIDGAAAVPCAIAAAPATLTDGATYPVGPLAGTETMQVTVAGAFGGLPQTVAAVGGETTAADIAALLNNQLQGVHCGVSGGHVVATTDVEGHDAAIQITTGGTLNAILLFPTALAIGTGNVGNRFAVTGLEVEAITEAAVGAGVMNAIVLGTGAMRFQTVATGSGHSIQIDVVTTSPNFISELNIDTAPHQGSNATPENTLQIAGKYAGAYTDAITTVVAAATSGVAWEFNLQILVNGVVAEVWPNLTMGDGVGGIYTQTNYVQTVINHPTTGSQLVAVTDQLLAYTPTLKRPANGTSLALSGGGDGLIGLVDADYLGNPAGPTGLHCFNLVSNAGLLVVPGKYSTAILLGALTYAETTRSGMMFCCLDVPPGYTKAQMAAWMASTGLYGRSEFGAVHWPRIKITNPSTSVYGTDEALVVPTAAAIAGKLAANDGKLGGLYQSPAGLLDGWGVIAGQVGVEDDPGGSGYHEVLDEVTRDLLYPLRVNPVSKLATSGWFIDGGRTLKATGNFPNIAEQRGVIYIGGSLKLSLEQFRHRNNTPELRRQVHRMFTRFLLGEMRAGAFRSTDPATAFFVDVSDALNPPSEVFAGRLNVRVGLATNKPAEFITLTITQDVRALAAELA